LRNREGADARILAGDGLMERWQQARLERLRKEQRKQEQDRPVLHAPRPQPPMWEELPEPKEKPPERGVAIIDFNL